MNAAQTNLISYATQRIHRTANIGMCIAALALFQALWSWLAVFGEAQRLHSLAIIFPGIAWALLFAGGHKSLTSLPITRQQYEMSRWLFVFAWPAMGVLAISSIVYITGQQLGKQPATQMWLLSMFYNAGLLGLLAALGNNDLIPGSNPFKYGNYKSSLSLGISGIVTICAMVGMPTSGYWFGVAGATALIGVLLGVFYPFVSILSPLRSPTSAFNNPNFELLPMLGLHYGPQSFFASRIVFAAAGTGALIAAEHLLINSDTIAPRQPGGGSFSGLCVLWLSYIYSFGNLRVFRALPLSLSHLAFFGLVIAWLPACFYHLWIFTFPGESPIALSTILTQLGLVAAFHALLLPFILSRFSLPLGWPTLPTLLGIILAHALVSVITRRLADDLAPAMTLAILTGAATISLLRTRNVLAFAHTIYQR